jgi:quercetin dioxygenase-like cupin family protein/rubrerythrin
MSDEPTYLPLLRRVANAECNAEVWLSAWADVTPRDDVRGVISTIALREGEHTKAFQKRICELGFDVTIEEAAETAERIAIAGSTGLSDRDKFDELGLGAPSDPSTPDRWASYFDDTTIDIATGELLGRFIAEERDSVRMLAGCYAALCGEEESPARGAGSTDDRLDRIERALAELLAKVGSNGETMTEADFRAGLRADGFDDEIRITSFDPNQNGELHSHDFSARLLVLDGALTLRYEDGLQTFTSGQCCQVDAGTVHAECTGTAGARVVAGLKHQG